MTTKIDTTPITTSQTILTNLAYHINVPPPHTYKSDWGCVHGPYLFFDPYFENKRTATIQNLLNRYNQMVTEENIDIEEYVDDINTQGLDKQQLDKLLEEEYNNIIKAFKNVSPNHIQSRDMLSFPDCMQCYKHCNRYIFISRQIIPPVSLTPESSPENTNIWITGMIGAGAVVAVVTGLFMYWKTRS